MKRLVAVDASDLYTLLRIFYEKNNQYTQAERRAAERLNTALKEIGWNKDPRKIN